MFVYPTRTYLQQRDQMNAAEQRLRVLRQPDERLKQETKKLKGDAEVERHRP